MEGVEDCGEQLDRDGRYSVEFGVLLDLLFVGVVEALLSAI